MAENKCVSGVINLLTGALLMGLVIEWAQGWLEDDPVSFWACLPIFKGELLVSGRVYMIASMLFLRFY